jgi:bifunctional UDP-N-acetylglucosamine pyrophosphorylase/glucosamine-1-phosphate N-acetyltransferase
VSASGGPAVILAAGKGKRTMRSAPKVLLPALGLPLLEHVLRAVEEAGAAPVMVVVGQGSEAVEAAFPGGRVRFVRQEPPLGTGHALRAAEVSFAAAAGRTLLVSNGDLPLLRGRTLAALLARHRAGGAAATLLTATVPDGGEYGRVVRDPGGGVRRIVEARDAKGDERAAREINAGVYAFEIPPLRDALSRLSPANAQGEYYLTDVIGLLAEGGHAVLGFAAEDPREALGVNTLAELAAASARLRERRLAELMAAGVLVEDPASTTVGLDAVVEADATLRPFTCLEGRTIVRAGALVGPFARLVDSEIGAGAQVLDHCLLRESVVEAGAVIGPFAHLRPETRVEAGARVGNFVELKKTRLGAGSKAPHLSYLGDATIGPGVNIGAGTITCNYDGSTKHPTRIDAGAFVGSDTTLVAPIRVGEGAYIAAGSAITEDVPAHALALGRARQVVKPDWARTRRPRKEAPKKTG